MADVKLTLQIGNGGQLHAVCHAVDRSAAYRLSGYGIRDGSAAPRSPEIRIDIDVCGLLSLGMDFCQTY